MSISQEATVIPIDFGSHQRMNSSGFAHASNTIRAGALKVRVTTSSRSDFRSAVVRFVMDVRSTSLVSIDHLLPLQLLDDVVELVEARGPAPAVALDPRCLSFEPARPELARPH